MVRLLERNKFRNISPQFQAIVGSFFTYFSCQHDIIRKGKMPVSGVHRLVGNGDDCPPGQFTEQAASEYTNLLQSIYF